MPGRNLLVFDDALVLARANFTDGAYGVTSRKNRSLEELTPAQVVDLHPDNWMVDGYTGHRSSEVANWRGRHIRHVLCQGLPTVITTRRLSCGSLSNFTGPTSRS